ncbi:Oidioi.mRNA.OKI2018_I69.XSR.g13269.t1.cds [Oikopleura dioica]|uniref:Transmembrane protein 231 n=1 Tax=Oikopleura dioica TaxID=34765 RepID=A0ABN7SA89_OIKDI|nr:Oidioi.mRNA.OKI2018_I69.XSR.g13269.t1.cds [Oikopleura dioica]
MLLWRRNLKINHFSYSKGLSFPLLYLIIGFLVVLVLPLLIIYHVDQVNSSITTDFVAPELQHSKESVLLLHTFSGESVIYSPGVADLADLSDRALCSTTIQPDYSYLSRIKVSYSCSVGDVIGFELYSYLKMKMPGFSKESEFINQLILTSDYSNNPSISAETNSHIRLNQFATSREHPNSALLPAKGVNISPAFLPSVSPSLWNGEEALKNQTRRNIRFDESHHQTRWTAGSDGSFQLTMNYELATMSVQREASTWSSIKYRFIQYMAFFTVFAFVFDKLNDFLFQCGVFASFSKLEKINQFKKD